jgi:SAM-dependent methyltransferase
VVSLDDIRKHWETWARSYGTDLRATTRTSTAKILEIDALQRAVAGIRGAAGRPLDLLEAGCGNGHNCIALARAFEDCTFTAFDYVPEMAAAARALAAEAGMSSRVTILEDDVTKLEHVVGTFDVVFTVRCLINLNSDELQRAAMARLATRVRPGGYLIMIENSRTTHGAQNRARELVGLDARAPATFNRFLDEATVRPHLASLGLAVESEDFGSLHDLALYVLAPMMNGGKVDYDHPLVAAATQLSLAMNRERPAAFGAFGQNRLFLCRKPV